MVKLYSTAQSALHAGDTVKGATESFNSFKHHVAFKFDLENHTKFMLDDPQYEVASGRIVRPPIPIVQGQKEAISGRQTTGQVTGCAGVVSWRIGDTGKMFVIMYRVPYLREFSTNWCALGIFPHDSIDDYFEKMYYDDVIGFARKKFSFDDCMVMVADDRFKATATMGTSRKSEIRVQLMPLSLMDLASSLKTNE